MPSDVEQCDVQQLVSGGYVVGAPAVRPAEAWKDLLPGLVFTRSDCLVKFIPDVWVLRWVGQDDESLVEEARKLGIPADRVGALVDKMTAAFSTYDFLWPHVFPTVGLARDFCREFLPDPRAFRIFGIGLHPDYRDEFLEDCAPEPPQERQGGYVIVHEPPGVYVCVREGMTVEPGGQPLGWEVLRYDTSGSFESWLCWQEGHPGPGPAKVYEKFGIRSGNHGLFQSIEDANTVADHYCATAVCGWTPRWDPWLLVRYDAVPQSETP
jgi:hypothetical protein